MKLNLLFEAKLTKKEIQLQQDKKDLLNLIKVIRQNCSEFLEREPSPIFRGFKSDNNFGKRRVRTKRRPLDTDNKIHKLYNDIFEEIFGVRAREMSVFASRRYDSARGYAGNILGIIFVPNKYQIIAAEKVDDLHNHKIPEFKYSEIKKIIKKVFPKMGRDDLEAHVYDYYGEDYESMLRATPVEAREAVLKAYKEKLKDWFYEMYDIENTKTIDKSELMIITPYYYYINLYYNSDINKMARKYSPKQFLIELETSILNNTFTGYNK